MNVIGRLQKEVIAAEIAKDWNSQREYIKYAVFGYEAVTIFDKKYAKRPANLIEGGPWVFKPATFPYACPPGTEHYILWNMHYDFYYPMEDTVLTTIITQKLMRFAHHFNFVYYTNPKPSILDFFHVQVFWTRNVGL